MFILSFRTSRLGIRKSISLWIFFFIEKRKKDVGGLFQDKKNKTKEHHRTDSSSKPLPVSVETGNETLRSGTGSTFEPEINQQQVSTSSIPLVSSNLNNGDSISAAASTTSSKEYDTVEKVEELIQMKKLPAETLAIHSPESASTTIIWIILVIFEIKYYMQWELNSEKSASFMFCPLLC